MTNVVDRRGKNKNKLAGSRKKFLDRHKTYIKKQINKHIKDKSIKDANSDIEINIGGIEEVKVKYDRYKSRKSRVHPGNKKYNKGDKIKLPKEGDGRGPRSGSNSDAITEDDFKFILTKDEFLDILFEDMALPNFLKKSNKLMTKKSFVTGGYIKDGIPARLAIKKTLENAIARRVASSNKENARFIDDIDLRYRNLIPEEKAISTATVFFVMDVSISMGESRKLLAKKFFLLFYLFLNKHYKNVNIHFISHTTEAFETDEDEFFYSTKSGGTIMSTAFHLVNDIIDRRYDKDSTNFYIAQASDGENFYHDNEELGKMVDLLLNKVQYFSYIEVDNSYVDSGTYAFYKQQFPDKKNLAMAIINKDSDVLKALYYLFEE